MGIHGDKSQQERDWVLNGECFLVAVNLYLPDSGCKAN